MVVRLHCVMVVLALAALQSGCATSQKSAPAARCGTDYMREQAAQCKWIRLTPLSRISTAFDNPDQTFSNLYTRVLINSKYTRDTDASKSSGNDGAAQENNLYGYNDRGSLLRAFWGTHYSMNLTAYVSVGSFQATVPLVTIDHTSNRSDGEKFQRIVAHTIQNFPLVLLKGDGSNAIATVHFVVKATDTTQSSAAAAAIEAAQGIAAAVAPEASVVTTLSSQATRDKAAALDKAINSVLARQLDEEQWLDNDVRRWNRGATVTFLIPPANNESAWGDTANFSEVGTWTLVFEAPRPSVFSDIQICLPVHAPDQTADTKATTNPTAKANSDYCRTDVPAAAKAAQAQAASRPEQVLSFSLLSGTQSLGSVNAYLKQQSWWDQSMKTFNGLKKDEQPDKDAIAQFCRSIKQTIAAVGLNSIDAGIVVAAVRDRGPLPPTVVSAMKADSAEDCQYASLPSGL
jgi:hypothetical protein